MYSNYKEQIIQRFLEIIQFFNVIRSMFHMHTAESIGNKLQLNLKYKMSIIITKIIIILLKIINKTIFTHAKPAAGKLLLNNYLQYPNVKYRLPSEHSFWSSRSHVLIVLLLFNHSLYVVCICYSHEVKLSHQLRLELANAAQMDFAFETCLFYGNVLSLQMNVFQIRCLLT